MSLATELKEITEKMELLLPALEAMQIQYMGLMVRALEIKQEMKEAVDA